MVGDGDTTLLLASGWGMVVDRCTRSNEGQATEVGGDDSARW